MVSEGLPPVSTVTSEILRRAYAQLDASRESIDQNWLSMMIAAGVSIGLVFGLDRAVSQAFFHTPAYGRVVGLVAPFVSFYLFFRFGSLSFDFSNAKFSARVITDAYVQENQPEKLAGIADQGWAVNRWLYSTTSYFDAFYAPDIDNSEGRRIGIFAAGILIPVVLALNHATSLYLLWGLRVPADVALVQRLGSGWQGRATLILAATCLIYLVSVLSCYGALYGGLRRISVRLQPGWIKFIWFIYGVSAGLTVALFLLFLAFGVPYGGLGPLKAGCDQSDHPSTNLTGDNPKVGRDVPSLPPQSSRLYPKDEALTKRLGS